MHLGGHSDFLSRATSFSRIAIFSNKTVTVCEFDSLLSETFLISRHSSPELMCGGELERLFIRRHLFGF